MTSLELVGVEYCGGQLHWTFNAAWTDRRTRIHVRTSYRGTVHDLQTDDNWAGGTGDARVDELVAERVRRVVILHGALNALDAAAADQSSGGWSGLPRSRRAA